MHRYIHWLLWENKIAVPSSTVRGSEGTSRTFLLPAGVATRPYRFEIIFSALTYVVARPVRLFKNGCGEWQHGNMVMTAIKPAGMA